VLGAEAPSRGLAPSAPNSVPGRSRIPRPGFPERTPDGRRLRCRPNSQ